MPNPTLRRARQMGMSIYRLVSRSEEASTPTTPTTPVLSSGALASIAIAGSVVFFLIIVGPILIKLARRRGRRRLTGGSVTSLSSAEHGHLSQDENFNGPRRLRKRSVVSDGAMYFGIQDAGSEGGRAAKHLSLPSFPPVISRPESYRSERGAHGGNGDHHRYENKARTGVEAGTDGGPMHASPEKRRGRAIYQNRRKTSWIDEDALHGPRVSPKKDSKRQSSWLPGRGLTRALSRHLSIHRFYAPELNRSPTLPCIETDPGRETVDGISRKSPESRKTVCANNAAPRTREWKAETETEIEPRFPLRQPLQQGGSLNHSRIPHAPIGGPGPQRASVPGATPPYPQGHNSTAGGAAHHKQHQQHQQQLQQAGRAPVPSFDIRVHAQRYARSQQQNNTDKELQAILRRTAERLQDGNRSTRRQTLMLPASSSPARVPGQAMEGGPDQDHGRGGDHAHAESAAPSPARSQRSAPAVLLHSEREGCSGSRIQQGPSSQGGGAPWQTHRRTYTREISHVSQMPSIPIFSKSDNLAATPTRRRAQADVLHAMLPSPSRSIRTPPSHTSHTQQQDFIPRSYSPASDQSSVLSTVYSEEEDSTLVSALPLETIPAGRSEMERQAMAQALRASEVFCVEQTQRADADAADDVVDADAGTGETIEGRRGRQETLETSHGPESLRERNESLERIIPHNTPTAASSPSRHQGGIERPAAARFPPQAMSTIPDLQTKTQDPFTTCTTPNRLTPQRLSQVFSPLPVKQPGDATSPSVDRPEPHSGTPTPSPSRRRVVPPPFRLRPGANSPTLGHYHDPQFQIQPPSRVPSPVESEGGLSSVYDSYRYSRYSDTTMLAVPPAETSPMRTQWDPTPLPATLTESETGDGRIESDGGGAAAASRPAHARLHHALAGTRAYTHFANPLGLSATEDGSAGTGFTAEDALPRSQPHRDITCSTVSCFSGESTYSQDDDGGDKLAPLMPICSTTTMTTTAASGKHTSRVMNAVAELRRMNSQVSCASAYSTATTAVTSPTLPALRGGGCSPGKKGTVGAAKHYFSLGNSSPRSGDREREDGYGYEEGRRLDAGGGGRDEEDEEARKEQTTAPVEKKRDSRDAYTLSKGVGNRRSRRNTVVESYEQDLDRARQVLRQSRGYNHLQSIREVSNAVGSGG